MSFRLFSPDRIAPTPADTERIRWEGVVAMCDWYVWRVNVLAAQVEAHAARAMVLVRQLQQAGYR